MFCEVVKVAAPMVGDGGVPVDVFMRGEGVPVPWINRKVEIAGKEYAGSGVREEGVLEGVEESDGVTD